MRGVRWPFSSFIVWVVGYILSTLSLRNLVGPCGRAFCRVVRCFGAHLPLSLYHLLYLLYKVMVWEALDHSIRSVSKDAWYRGHTVPKCNDRVATKSARHPGQLFSATVGIVMIGAA